MSSLAHGIGIPIEAVKGHRISRYQVEARLSKWERYEELVVRDMPRKGFSELEVGAALAECQKMIDFYDTLLEQYE